MDGRITAVEHCLESGIDAMRKSLIELMNRAMNIRETPQSSAVTVNLSLEEFPSQFLTMNLLLSNGSRLP
ncbi:hypothetical protein A2U01_0021292, partial [Trifolium medium]|nr:hypothetical protein [Trifolium medium]